MRPETLAHLAAGFTLAALVIAGASFVIGEWWAKRRFYSEDDS